VRELPPGRKYAHRNILNVGKLTELATDVERRQLADRIEQIYSNTPALFPAGPAVEKLAQHFAALLRNRKASENEPQAAAGGGQKETAGPAAFENIDLDSVKHPEARELGAEWLVRQAAAQLQLAQALKDNNLNVQQVQLALVQITGRAVYPGSERKTQSWLRDNSAACQLHGTDPAKVSRYRLYESALGLYGIKGPLEAHLSKTTNGIFNLGDTLLVYDISNTYFEGRKEGSGMAAFGRSKEKRSDCKLIVLALVINAEGFVKYSKFYKGNTADCTTLQQIMGLLRGPAPVLPGTGGQKQIVALDAAFSTEDNIKWLRDNGYDYISVSRAKPKDYTLACTDPVTITDNRQHPIELGLVREAAPNGDKYLYIRSHLKTVKEESMDKRAAAKLEEELNSLGAGLSKKGTTKKLDSITKRVGRITERNKAAAHFYDISVQQKDGLATALTWQRKETHGKSSHGIYFLRTSLQDRDEKTLWKIYNTTTEIEATFRILKTDLEMRPVFHKNDKSSEAHIFLAILAYGLVATIRHQLKIKGIHDDWREIIRKMNTQKLITTSMKNDKGQTIIIQQPSEPTADVKEIYDALGYKHKPWARKKFVLPEL